MIDLAAAVWGIPQESAIRRLAESGISIPESFYTPQAEYNFTFVKRRRQAADLWVRSRDQLEKISTASAKVRKLRERLRLYSRGDSDRWKNGPGRMFGAATFRQIQEALLAPGVLASYKLNNGSALFQQSGWLEAALLFPYFSAPENLAGFLFVGREARLEDRVYRSVVPTTLEIIEEGGLFGFDTTMEPPHVCGHHVVAVDDPIMAMRLQVRHSLHSAHPLPLVAYRDHRKVRTRLGWHSLTRPVTIWAWKMTASAIYAAMQTDGKIAIMPLEEDTSHNKSHYLRASSPVDLLNRVIANGVPWQEAFTTWASDQSIVVVEAILAELRSRQVDTDELAHRLGLESRAVQHVRTYSTTYRLYTERNGGWYVIKRGTGTAQRERRLSDYIVRLDYVTTTGSQPWYIGRVIWQDRTTHFAGTSSNLRNAIRLACLNSGLGFIGVEFPGLSLEKLALAFQRPQLIGEEAAVAMARSLGVEVPNASKAKFKAQNAGQPKAPKLSIEVVPVDLNGIDVAE